MKKIVVLLAMVAIMATFFLTSCQEEEDYQIEPIAQSGLYIRAFLREYPTPDTEVLITADELTKKSATITDTTEYLFKINGDRAEILNDNSVTVLNFRTSKDKADFSLSDGREVTAYKLPFSSYGTSTDFPFNGVIRARNFLFAINGENSVRILDLETGDYGLVKTIITDNEITMIMGIFLPSLEFIGTNPNGVGNIFKLNWLTKSYPGYSLTAQKN